MAKSKKNIKKKGITLYNKILKEFTKVNNKLPIERQLSIADRRKYIKEVLLPKYKGTSPHRLAVKTINTAIVDIFDSIPPQIGCDVNLLSPSVYADIGFFEIDDYILNVLPKCIYIRIDAQQYGKTKIFNTLNYNYTKSGVKVIVDNIREVVNNNSGLDISVTGVKKLKKGKTNDGTPDNYFLDFILVINGEPKGDIDPIIFNVPASERKAVKSIRNVINERIRQLELKKKRKKNARKTAIRNLNKVKSLGIKQRLAKRQTTKDKLEKEKYSVSYKSLKQLDRAYSKGLFTPEQYDRLKGEIIYRMLQKKKKGGKI